MTLEDKITDAMRERVQLSSRARTAHEAQKYPVDVRAMAKIAVDIMREEGYAKV